MEQIFRTQPVADDLVSLGNRSATPLVALWPGLPPCHGVACDLGKTKQFSCNAARNGCTVSRITVLK
jgi:uncharacterized 2Fe-2S/4Fe-4S cluster protein (DUF4445 family)